MIRGLSGQLVAPQQIRLLHEKLLKARQRGPQINQGAVAQQLQAPAGPMGPLGTPGELDRSEAKALKYLRAYQQMKLSGQPINWPNKLTKLRILNPTSAMQFHLEQNPELKAVQHELSQQFMLPQAGPKMNPMSLAQGLQLEQQMQAQKEYNVQHPMQSNVFGDVGQLGGLPGWGQKLLGQVADTAIGVGPGLYHLAGGEAHDVANNPLYAIGGPISMLGTPTSRGVGKGIAQSVGRTVEHPIRDIQQDPLNAISNLALGAGAVAGTAARVSELSKVGELADAANTSKIRQIGKTLLRPQTMKREIRLIPPVEETPGRIRITHQGGDKVDQAIEAKIGQPIGPDGMITVPPNEVGDTVRKINTIFSKQKVKGKAEMVEPGVPSSEGYSVHPPAMRGALGGYFQTKLLDPLTAKAMEHSNVSLARAFTGLGKEFKVGANTLEGISPQGRVGKYIRQDTELEGQMSRGVEEQRMLDQMERASTDTRKWGRMMPEAPLWNESQLFPTDALNLPQVRQSEQSLKLPDAAASAKERMKPAFLQQHPWARTVPVVRMPDGEIRVGFPGLTHDDSVTAADFAKYGIRSSDPDAWLQLTKQGMVQGTGHIDKETGKVIRVNANRDNPAQEREMKDAANDILSGNPQGPTKPSYLTNPQEAQRVAFARGWAKMHYPRWQKLYDAGQGNTQAFLKDPEAYVGVKKPPDEPPKWENYTSESGIAREWRGMVETNIDKLKADPNAYSFIPKGAWQRMHMYTPGTGTLTKFIDAIDRGTQIIRIGRFLHPGYAGWAIQNGILATTSQGMWLFRNAYQLRREVPKLSKEDQAMFKNAVGAGHFGGGIARATEGSGKFSKVSGHLAGVWHQIDDAYWRAMQLIHDLNHAGYHDAKSWSTLMHENPDKFRAIARGSQREAIDYSEMSPTERATAQKLFTAWGWTRGASTYTLRYPLQHPVQARALTQIGQQGQDQVNKFYSDLGGLPPAWLKGYLPVGNKLLLQSGILNPGETFGQLLGSIPGAVPGQTESLATQEAPVPMMLQEGVMGLDRYGKQLRGGQRVTTPLSDLFNRFEPVGAIKDMLTTKHGGGTFQQGVLSGLNRWMGVPIEHLNNPKQTAALGEKDYEQALSKSDEINFRLKDANQKLPHEIQLYTKAAGSPPPPQLIAKLKADFEAVAMRDHFQLSYANAHGANSFRSLPAQNKVQAAISFLTQHKYISPSDARMYITTATQFKDDRDLETLSSELWALPGIGQWVSEWKSAIKEFTPPTITPARP